MLLIIRNNENDILQTVSMLCTIKYCLFTNILLFITARKIHTNKIYIV